MIINIFEFVNDYSNSILKHLPDTVIEACGITIQVIASSIGPVPGEHIKLISYAILNVLL